jgi:hypothetical protein
MHSTNENTVKRNSKRRIFFRITGVLFLIVAAAGIYLYYNFNHLLASALLKSFNSNIASDVYELKFRDLKVNPISGNIRVKDVSILPRDKFLKDYSYINSKLSLVTDELILDEVDLAALLKENKLKLGKIVIDKPRLQVEIDDKMPVFLPFKEAVTDSVLKGSEKRNIESFSLKNFDLKEASLQLQNHAKGRYLNLKDLNINLRDLSIDQQPGIDRVKYSAFAFNIGEISGHLKRDSIRSVSLNDFGITIDSMEIEKTLDTFIYKYSDFNLGFRNLMVVPGDSAFSFSVKTFSVAYADSLLNLEKVSFVPNIGEKEMRKRFKYQHNTSFSAEVSKLNIEGICFDSLFLARKLLVRNIEIDSAFFKLFKDKTKPVDKKHLPEYLGQSVKKIPVPVVIGNISVTNINLVSREIKPDGTTAEVTIGRGEASISSFTNQSEEKPLALKASAFLGEKVKFQAGLAFSYAKPEFEFNGSFDKFRLNDLNEIIQNYAPVSVSEGIVDVIRFSGKATENKASGTMEFLYHDLKMDVNLKEKAEWKNSVLSFAANTAIASSNPVSEGLPPKVVNFGIERDMNKAFVNVVIKSALAGLKETVIMSKENKKAYREAKKQAKTESRQK